MGVKVREKVKGSGDWWVFINFRGRRKARKIGSRKAALQTARKIEEKIGARKFRIEVPGEGIPFGKYAEKWMEGHVRMNCKDSSIHGYRNMLDNHVLPAFGTTPLSDITREAIKEFCYRKREAGAAPRTIRYKVATISGVLSAAI